MLGFTIAIALAMSGWIGPTRGGTWTFLPLLIAFGVFPILELITPTDRNSPATWPAWTYKTLLYAFAAYHVFIIFWGAHFVTAHPITAMQFIGIAGSIGFITGAIGITVSHELIHRRDRFDRLLGEAILVLVSYGHFAVEHVRGHHLHMGTPRDPATARKGESLYQFFLRSLVGSFRSAYRLKPSRVTGSLTCSLLISVLLGLAFGSRAAIFFYAQGIVAILLLETINYIEHYGLRRREISPGRYEAVKGWHSWDSDCLITSKLLINLQRHADHHLHPMRNYQELELIDEAPMLPTGYAGMILLAAFPPLWRRVMDARIPA